MWSESQFLRFNGYTNALTIQSLQAKAGSSGALRPRHLQLVLCCPRLYAN